LNKHTYLVDTPGFTSLTIEDFEIEELAHCFPEFSSFEPQCRFRGCSHLSEPDCAVRTALDEGLISQSRYLSYSLLYKELSEKDKYK